MSLQTYSRDYLKSIHQEIKKQKVDTIIQGFINDLRTAAATGMTSYRYVRPTPEMWPSSEAALTDAEIIAGFFERFPGCNIYTEGVWLEKETKMRGLKKVSIVIDWS